MNIDQLLKVTGCNSLHELEKKYDFRLRLSKHYGVILEELGTFGTIKSLVSRIEGLVYEGFDPEDIKVSVLEKNN